MLKSLKAVDVDAERHRLVLENQPREVLAVHGGGVEVSLEMDAVRVGRVEEDRLSIRRPCCVFTRREQGRSSRQRMGEGELCAFLGVRFD